MSPSTYVEDVRNDPSPDPGPCGQCSRPRFEHHRMVLDGAKRPTDVWVCPTALFEPDPEWAELSDEVKAQRIAQAMKSRPEHEAKAIAAREKVAAEAKNQPVVAGQAAAAKPGPTVNAIPTPPKPQSHV